MKKAICSGDVFGELTIVGEVARDKNRKRMFLCRCVCGEEKAVCSQYLAEGKSICRHKKQDPLYSAWRGMKSRCYTRSAKGYENYGGRGISVCEAWRESFHAFKRDMGERPEGCTLDRIDSNGDYCPENCRWSPLSVQANNKRSSVRIMVDSVCMTVSEWCRLLPLPEGTVRSRLNRGWSPEETLLVPHGQPRSYLERLACS